jgi:hypothetical protein
MRQRKKQTPAWMRLDEIAKNAGLESYLGLAMLIDMEKATLQQWAARDVISKEGGQRLASKFDYRLEWILSGTLPKRDKAEGDRSGLAIFYESPHLGDATLEAGIVQAILVEAKAASTPMGIEQIRLITDTAMIQYRNDRIVPTKQVIAFAVHLLSRQKSQA